MGFPQIIISVVSGGLAGAGISVISNRTFYRRALRTKLYPKVLNMFSAYAIRTEKEEGRYWTGLVGFEPYPENIEFVDHRSSFISELIEFNELKEARELRRRIVSNQGETAITEEGQQFRVDLKPELEALSTCMSVLHKKLNLD